jgi:hypothetical protein
VRASTHFGAFVAVLTCLAPLASEEPNPPVEVYVCVSDGAGIPAAALRKAQEEVVRIFGQAGVTVRWTECPQEERPPVASCRRGAGRPELTLRLEVRPPKDRKRRGIPMGHAWMPAGGEPGCLASVYSSSVEQTIGRPLSGSGMMLGHAMAHELGHLLLGSREHSHVGIMRHVWRREEVEGALRGTLFFLPHEAARLRAEILLRAAR